PDGAPWRRLARPVGVTAALEGLEGRVLVVAGRGAGRPAPVLAASARHGWPVLADALSGARTGQRSVVAAFDAIVADPRLRERLRPDVVLALGAPPAGRALGDALAAWSARVVAVAEDGWPPDPRGLVTDVVVAPPTDWLSSLAELPALDADAAYLAAWRAADDAVQAVFDEGCATELTEPAVARALSRLGGDLDVVVSSSMPIRDMDAFGASTPSSVRVLANRGANGIDGIVSTSLGVAAGGRAIGLLGDLAFLHDAGGLADGVGEAGGTCVLVVVDNRGGGIFSFLPQRASLSAATFERAFGTPPSASVASVALGYGATVHEVKDLDALRAAVDTGLHASGVTVVVAAVPDRERNVELHRALTARAQRAALDALGG
ncbi:MAG TPA: thiamine pyrophosphate-dependent enzyme, partial [Acidimicrobiales bacterium]|nr:thiamine pyrophosphate-dependent enzyme [Acidimicrobiales bacterium]